MEFIFMGSRRSARVAVPSFGANFQTGMSAGAISALPIYRSGRPPRPAFRLSVYNISSV